MAISQKRVMRGRHSFKSRAQPAHSGCSPHPVYFELSCPDELFAFPQRTTWAAGAPVWQGHRRGALTVGVCNTAGSGQVQDPSWQLFRYNLPSQGFRLHAHKHFLLVDSLLHPTWRHPYYSDAPLSLLFCLLLFRSSLLHPVCLLPHPLLKCPYSPRPFLIFLSFALEILSIVALVT